MFAITPSFITERGRRGNLRPYSGGRGAAGARAGEGGGKSFDLIKMGKDLYFGEYVGGGGGEDVFGKGQGRGGCARVVRKRTSPSTDAGLVLKRRGPWGEGEHHAGRHREFAGQTTLLVSTPLRRTRRPREGGSRLGSGGGAHIDLF